MPKEKPRVLLVARDGTERMQAALGPLGTDLTVATDLATATARFNARLFDALLIEVDLPETGAPRAIDSADALTWLSARADAIPVLAFGPAQLEGAALRAGALGFLTSPEGAGTAAIELALRSVIDRHSGDDFDSSPLPVDSGLLGNSPHITAVKDTINRVSGGAATVLVRGETGTGKELVARAVHDASPRRHAPFIKVHAAALPDGLLESELFGYEKGAFTGASTRKGGRVELAEGGTLFFDEIGEISPLIQAKLLRLVQDRAYERLGGTRTFHANIRLVAATHRDLEQMVASGAFREDLFYRLNVVTIWLPPLRARRKDVGVIARHYFERFRSENGKSNLELHPDAVQLLQAQRWPGNVRQLVNFVERLVVLARGAAVTVDDVRCNLEEQSAFLTQATSHGGAQPRIPELARSAAGNAIVSGEIAARLDSNSTVLPLREETRRMEYRVLTKALRSANGNRALAARMLGVSRRTLYTKLEEHGIE